MKYWINTVTRDHVLIGKEGGFVQSGHGKESPLKRMSKGDMVIFYSPKASLKDGGPLKRFTALACLIDDRIYQVTVSNTFKPYRRNAEYFRCQEAEVLPLIEQLNFITNKKSWGFRFRFGLFEIPKKDFEIISRAMKTENTSNFPEQKQQAL
jgi:predicted RNA-binding protein